MILTPRPLRRLLRRVCVHPSRHTVSVPWPDGGEVEFCQWCEASRYHSDMDSHDWQWDTEVTSVAELQKASDSLAITMGAHFTQTSSYVPRLTWQHWSNDGDEWIADQTPGMKAFKIAARIHRVDDGFIWRVTTHGDSGPFGGHETLAGAQQDAERLISCWGGIR